MSHFVTRVELHNAGEEDYTALHDAMEQAGFSRTITSDEGKEYHLPTAQYCCSGDFSLEKVLKAAKAAASTTGKRHAVIVTQGPSTWSGLDPVS
jgi:hypothetical protein